jgi:two-component system CheB/CheR fusion protein
VDQRLRALEDELLVAREHLSAAVQDLEASNEQLQATNEELTASNEELQSTNEELQSVNEELYTANSEYQEKIGELVEINADLENLLRVVDAGVLFLDEGLMIRRFNDSATRLFPLRYEDLGRPLCEIALQADYKSLTQDAQDVLRAGARKVTTVLGHDGAWWSIGVRAAGDRIGSPGGGVIVTMHEISELKRATSELSRYKHAHEMAENASGIGHAVLDLANGVVHYSEGARLLFGIGDSQPPIEEGLALFATETSRSSAEMLESLRLETGLPFTTERELSVARGERIRLKLSVQAKLDPASGEKLVFAVFHASQPPS